MSVIADAVNRWFQQHAVTNSPAAATRVVAEPLESRMLLSGSVATHAAPALIQAGGRQIEVLSASHKVNAHKPGPTAFGRLLAQPAVEISGPTVTRAGSAAGGISSPTPLADTVTPSQLRQAYGFNFAMPDGSAATGAGETIAIVDAFHDPNIQSDLHIFDQQYFGGVDPSFTQVNLGTTATGSWHTEEALDVEWAHAMAPQANIVLVEAASNSNTDLNTAVDKAVAMGAQVVSMSWGSPDNSGESANDGHFTAPNVTFVACSGDYGAPGWYPAASPNVLGVGGTSVLLDVNNNVSDEVGWQYVGNASSGGSVSAYEPRPAYQPATYSNGTTTGIALTGRGIPDVSYHADPNNGISVYDSAVGVGWIRVGGTSCGAPQWAAIIALADQARAQQGQAALGTADVHTALYANPNDLRDIVAGTSTGNPNYTAGPGYDVVTGLGSPQVPLVVTTLAGSISTAPATPPGLWAIPGDGQVTLNWGGSIGATGYNVYRSTDGVTYSPDATISATSFAETNLTDGVSYSYKVTAFNSTGESAAGAVASATPQVSPPAPTQLSAGIGTTSTTVSLHWAASPGVSEYMVERAMIVGGGWATIASDVQGTSFNDVDATNGRTYYYTVTAVTPAGEQSADSNVATITIVPAAPTGLAATTGNAQIALSWSASTGATSYTVLRSTTNGSGYSAIATGISTASYTDSKVTVGKTYYYVVEAVDAGGTSAPSNQAAATAKHGK